MINKNIVYYLIVNKSNIVVNNNLKNLDKKKSLIVLKKMLHYLNIDYSKIYKTTYGKPYFKNSEIFFNYSHSKNYIACVISYYEVGIDIEETNRLISDIVANKYLDGEKDNNKRIEIWVRKESFCKLKGLGLRINLNNINLNTIKAKNFLINNNNYICSIYCDNNNLIFKDLKDSI